MIRYLIVALSKYLTVLTLVALPITVAFGFLSFVLKRLKIYSQAILLKTDGYILD